MMLGLLLSPRLGLGLGLGLGLDLPLAGAGVAQRVPVIRPLPRLSIQLALSQVQFSVCSHQDALCSPWLGYQWHRKI